MFYAWVDGIKRAPLKKGERTICKECGGLLTSVIPIENVPHWRHKAGDCDNWSEPEGIWHLTWKGLFPLENREVRQNDPQTGEWHIADIHCKTGDGRGKVLELQHSSISEEERKSRESFYLQSNQLYWLINIHDQHSFNTFNFGMALDCSDHLCNYGGYEFRTARWFGRSSRFIDVWKSSNANVFFDFKGRIYYIANQVLTSKFKVYPRKGTFVYCKVDKKHFINTILGL